MPEIVLTLGDSVISKTVFDKDVISIGRSRDNDVVVENLAVSRNHARIRRQDGKFVLTDLNSANGTFVNGVRVTKTELFHDDVISIGKHRLVFKNEPVRDEALISDAFGAERTMFLDRTPSASVVVRVGKQKDMEFRVDKAETAIGRGTECEICLHDWWISKQHATIHRQGNTFLLRDAGSWRGTRVNEIQITETVLKDGDEIQVGRTKLLFRLVTEQAELPPASRVPRELAAVEPAAAEPAGVPSAPEPEPEIFAAMEEAGAEEEEPIRAGGREDYIEPSTRKAPDVVEFEEGTEPAEQVPPSAERDLAAEKWAGEEFLRGAIREAAAPAQKVRELTPAAESPPQPVEPAPAPRGAPEPAEAVTEEPVAAPSKPAVKAPQSEIEMWEAALKNPSPVIRKQAAKMLKKLTGIDYDY